MEQRWGLPLIAWPSRLRPNYWDLVALPLVLGLLALIAWGGMAMGAHYQIGDALPISLDPWKLPEYALRTVLRMGAALVASLVFSLAYAALAAKNRTAEKILIPVLDILQSVPILGFLSITVTGFIALFPGRLLGVECAAIFAIFTSQAWNMTFSLYQSLRTVPGELIEAARMYHLSSWQRFWRLEVPHGIPALVWNMMMSVSGGWFFVVASEAITVSGQSIMLPGIGSYIATAIAERNLGAIGYAVLVMLVVIILYDQLLFRPLLAWSQKFKGHAGRRRGQCPAVVPDRDAACAALRSGAGRGTGRQSRRRHLFTCSAAGSRPHPRGRREASPAPAGFERAFDVFLLLATLGAIAWMVHFILETVSLGEVGWAFVLGRSPRCACWC